MQDLLPIPSCFYSNNSVSDESSTAAAAATRVGQSLVLSSYRTVISGQSQIITVTWCRNLLAVGLYISIETSNAAYSCKVEMRPWHFWRRHGTKRFDVDNKPVDIFWDLKSAKFCDEPGPVSDYYVAVVYNEEIVLLLGDQKHDAFRRTNSRPSIFDAILVCKKEHVFGKRKFTTRAKFDDKSKYDHEICVEINGGAMDCKMLIKVDGGVFIEVKHLQWKFRGHDCVFIDKVKVEVYWDVHDWLFSSNGLRHALFVFKSIHENECSSSSASSTSSLELSYKGNDFCSSSDFRLFLYAWKLD